MSILQHATEPRRNSHLGIAAEDARGPVSRTHTLSCRPTVFQTFCTTGGAKEHVRLVHEKFRYPCPLQGGHHVARSMAVPTGCVDDFSTIHHDPGPCKCRAQGVSKSLVPTQRNITVKVCDEPSFNKHGPMDKNTVTDTAPSQHSLTIFASPPFLSLSSPYIHPLSTKEWCHLTAQRPVGTRHGHRSPLAPFPHRNKQLC